MSKKQNNNNMNTTQKRYALERIQSQYSNAHSELINMSRTHPDAERSGEIDKEIEALIKNGKQNRPASAAVLRKVVADAIADDPRHLFSRYNNIVLADLVTNEHHAEIDKLRKEKGALDKVNSKRISKLEIQEVALRVLLQRTKDDIMLGTDGIAALADFARQLDKITNKATTLCK